MTTGPTDSGEPTFRFVSTDSLRQEWKELAGRALTALATAKETLDAVVAERDDLRARLAAAEKATAAWADLFSETARLLGCNARGILDGNTHVLERARYLSSQFTGERYVANMEAEKQRDAAIARAENAERELEVTRSMFTGARDAAKELRAERDSERRRADAAIAERDHYAVRLGEEQAKLAIAEKALGANLAAWVLLAESGDAGWWDHEKDPLCIETRAALEEIRKP